MLIQFDLGDWSWDGHKVTFTVVAESSHSAQEVADAYQRACRRFDFVLHDRVCGLYEEYAIGPAELQFLQSLGYTPAPDFDPAYVKPADMFAMFVTMVQAGDPSITMTVITPEPFFIPGTPDRSFHLGYGALG